MDICWLFSLDGSLGILNIQEYCVPDGAKCSHKLAALFSRRIGKALYKISAKRKGTDKIEKRNPCFTFSHFAFDARIDVRINT